MRRAIFLLLALLAVLALKRSEGCSLSAMFETLSPPPATKSGAGDRVYQLRVDPPNPGR